jgi:hypothetical protein
MLAILCIEIFGFGDRESMNANPSHRFMYMKSWIPKVSIYKLDVILFSYFPIQPKGKLGGP